MACRRGPSASSMFIEERSDPVFLAPCGCQYLPRSSSSSYYVTNRWFCRLGEKELQIMICLALWRITDAADQCLPWTLVAWAPNLTHWPARRKAACHSVLHVDATISWPGGLISSPLASAVLPTPPCPSQPFFAAIHVPSFDIFAAKRTWRPDDREWTFTCQSSSTGR